MDKEQEINDPIKDGDNNIISDVYHTYGELHQHRIALFIALCKVLIEYTGGKYSGSWDIWKSKKHHDGTEFDGWFIAGIGIEKGDQISYHLPVSKWDETDFIKELDKAPEWDGHTSADVLKRISEL